MALVKNIENVHPKDCTGCYGCMNVCTHDAISMHEDERGFMHPKIDKDKCVNCGLCYVKCPVVTSCARHAYDAKAYSVAASNEICLQSTSGGVFTILAQYILQSQGVVFGARSNGLEQVWHDTATSNEELAPLRGSKYFQSEIGLSYRKVKEYLRNNKKVLFVGTPCQIAGLRNYLGKEYSNLYACDLVCHGVPSKAIFRRFVQEYEEKYKTKLVRYYRERTKWAPCIFTKEFSKNTGEPNVTWDNITNTWKEYKLYDEDEFNLLFHSNLIQRESCRHCRFCHIPRVGDITLGDDWAYYNEHINEPDKLKYGRSYVIINNIHGQQLFEQVKEQFSACEEREYVGGHHIDIPPKKNPLTEMFFWDAKHKKIFDILWAYTIIPSRKVKCALRVIAIKEKLYRLVHRVIRKIKRILSIN